MKDKILIVEDDPFAQQFYKFLFQRTNFDVLITEDGDEIFKLLDSEIIKAVILDINLKNTYVRDKKVDGVYLSQRIKSDYKIKNIPVLVVTAYKNEPGDSDYFSASKADDFVIKPISDFNKFLEKVYNLIENGTRKR